MRTLAGLLLASAVFVLNPAFVTGCTDDLEPLYGAKEINAALAGTWTVTLHDGSRASYRIELAKRIELRDVIGSADTRSLPVIRESPLIENADACGGHTIVMSASACVDSADILVEMIMVTDATKRTTGTLRVTGPRFDEGRLHVALGPRDVLDFAIDANGSVRDNVSLDEVNNYARVYTRPPVVHTPGY